MIVKLFRIPQENQSYYFGILIAQNMKGLFWAADEFCDPNETEFCSPPKGRLGISILVEQESIEKPDCEEGEQDYDDTEIIERSCSNVEFTEDMDDMDCFKWKKIDWGKYDVYS